jgi:transcriptional regulator with XRE-family HTH domain
MNAQGTTGKRRVRDRIREILLSKDPTAGMEYFVDGFVTEAMLALSRLRRESGLTQGQVARRMNTKQPAVARWEADLSGTISLENYARFAAACGAIPFDLTFVPVGNLREYALFDPDAPRTAEAYTTWRFGNVQSTLPSGNTVVPQPQSTTSLSAGVIATYRQQTLKEAQNSAPPLYKPSQEVERNSPQQAIA